MLDSRYVTLYLLGWLEPMLARIGANESNVVVPVIDVISDDNFKYVYHMGSNTIQVGGFDWNMQYNWHPMPNREKRRRKSSVAPIRYRVLILN